MIAKGYGFLLQNDFVFIHSLLSEIFLQQPKQALVMLKKA